LGEAEARRRMPGGWAGVRGGGELRGLVTERSASSARVDRGSKMGALLDKAHSRAVAVVVGECLGLPGLCGCDGGGGRV
jgi:hypothetical protein